MCVQRDPLSMHTYVSLQVILLITGTLHERDTHELLERCHPLVRCKPERLRVIS